MLDSNKKARIMEVLFEDFKVKPHMTYNLLGRQLTYRCKFKNVPIEVYNDSKRYIDFTRYYAIFRGPRKRQVLRSYMTGQEFIRIASSTRKRDAVKVDIYEYQPYQIANNRQQRMDYLNYCLQGK